MHSLDLSELKSQPPSRQVLVDESGCVQEKIEAECSGSTGHKEAWLGLEGQGKSDGGWGALRRPPAQAKCQSRAVGTGLGEEGRREAEEGLGDWLRPHRPTSVGSRSTPPPGSPSEPVAHSYGEGYPVPATASWPASHVWNFPAGEERATPGSWREGLVQVPAAQNPRPLRAMSRCLDSGILCPVQACVGLLPGGSARRRVLRAVPLFPEA